MESDPPQVFAAGFELSGAASQGQLKLFTPLGTTVAELSWTPQQAQMLANGKISTFDSLDALATQATGAPIPIASLFDWLQGRGTPAPGWQPDLSQLAQGRIQAQRFTPLPAAELKIVLDQ